MKEITASVTGQNLVLDQTVLNVAGTVNLYKLKITFDKDWEGVDTRIVSFANGCGKAIAVEYDETNGVTIPWEVLQAPEGQIGKVHIGVLGYAGTALRITTTSAYEANVLIVMPASLGLEAAMTPTPDIYQKLLQAIAAEDSKMGQLTNLDTDDKSNLVAAINEVLSKIEQGGGTVKSVNNIEPDDNGNITLPIPNKTSQLTNDSNFQNDTQTAATANAAVATHNTSNTAHADIREALNGKQAALSTDQMKAVNSGIDSTKVGQIATNTTNIASNSGEIAAINGKIPAQATSSNQLADKNFVNSTVQTASANFRGNWATWNAVPSDANDYPADADGNKTPTKNDYMVVQDASGYPTSPDPALAGAWRFKYTGTWATDGKNGWHPEYQVNETPLTEAQLAALNSGMTAEAVTKLGGIESGAEVNDINSISFDGTALTPDADKNVNIPAQIKTLTTADYNYPTTGEKTSVALWLLPTGVYKIAANTAFRAYSSSASTRTKDIVAIVTSYTSNDNKMIIVPDTGGSYTVMAVGSTGSVIDPSFGLYQMLTGQSVINNLTSWNASQQPLSAKQGYALKSLIDSLVIKNAGAPTTSTVGTVGMLLEDTTNGKLYQCTAVTTENNTTTYTWEEVGGGGGGGITTLTSADYDYPTNNPVGVALWKLPAGVYKIAANTAFYPAYTGTNTVTADTLCLIFKAPGDTNGTIEIWNDNNGHLSAMSVTNIGSASTAFSPSSSFPWTIITAKFVENNLTSTSAYKPLSANQGRVLNNNIGTLANLTTTDKTSTVAAINELEARIAALELEAAA